MKEIYSAQFGQLLKTMRRERGLSQEALAEAANISRKYVVKLENGQADPSLAVLRGIARGLGVAFSDFALRIDEIPDIK